MPVQQTFKQLRPEYAIRAMPRCRAQLPTPGDATSPPDMAQVNMGLYMISGQLLEGVRSKSALIYKSLPVMGDFGLIK